MSPLALAALASAVLLVACTTRQVDPMEMQPKVLPYRMSPIFSDHRAMRPEVADTVAAEDEVPLADLYTLGPDGGRPSTGAPRTDLAMLQVGRAHFDVLCAACHGLVGDGVSVVARKMSLRPPPSLVAAPIRNMTDGDIFAVITLGYGLMPSYRDRLTLHDRWAVISYVRALQESQSVPVQSLPSLDRAQFALGAAR